MFTIGQLIARFIGRNGSLIIRTSTAQPRRQASESFAVRAGASAADFCHAAFLVATYCTDESLAGAKAPLRLQRPGSPRRTLRAALVFSRSREQSEEPKQAKLTGVLSPRAASRHGIRRTWRKAQPPKISELCNYESSSRFRRHNPLPSRSETRIHVSEKRANALPSLSDRGSAVAETRITATARPSTRTPPAGSQSPWACGRPTCTR
jgi:hypothetical protein